MTYIEYTNKRRSLIMTKEKRY